MPVAKPETLDTTGPNGQNPPVRQRLALWFSPPSAEDPAETLRWVRRISLVLVLANLAVAVDNQLRGAMVWPFLVGGLLLASSWVMLTPAIRGAEREPRGSEDEDHMGRRGSRATYLVCALYCLTFPIPGFLVGGVGGAVFFEALALITSLCSIWLWTRYLRHRA